MKNRPSIPVLVLGLCLAASQACATYLTVNNNVWWKDQNGHPIYAQGGGIAKFGSTYYMYGVEYGGAHTYYNGGGSNSDTSFKNITCYTSTDLVNWKFSNEAVTPSQLTGSAWVGRMGSVCYNSASGKYVMWVGYSGTLGTGVACLTSSSPTGTFTLNNVQTSIGNVYYNVPGDMTVFCDINHGSKPYLIFSDPHGRQHAYVSDFNSTQTFINNATHFTNWPQGQEANCMFEFQGVYHYVTSETNGWSFSNAYEVHSTNILSGYTADAAWNGTTNTHTYWSQISYFFDLHGSSQETILAIGDRWADFSSKYASAGHGNNYLIMEVVLASGTWSQFNDVATWQLEASTGKWK